MKRYALVHGERERLRAEIRSHIAGNQHNDKPIGDLLDALAALDNGADEAAAGDFVYRVAYDSHPAPLSRTDHREGTRQELVAELTTLRDDRAAQGRADKVAALNEAIEDLDGPRQAACTSALGTVYLVAHTED